MEATIGDFQIGRRLGEGSQGPVYLAQQLSLRRPVALKLSPNVEKASRTLAVLEHDHIVRVFSEQVELDQTLRLICMQYVPGASLARVIQELAGRERACLTGADLLEIVDRGITEPLALTTSALEERAHFARMRFAEAVAWIGARLADALAFAHRRGVHHLDLKTSDIILSPWGRPVLGGFRLRSLPFGAEAADVRGLGEVLWELFLGRRPVDGGADGLAAVPRRVAPCAGERVELVAVLRPALDWDPARRYCGIAAMEEALNGYLERRRICRDLPPPGRLMRYSLRYPLLALLTVRVPPLALGTVIASLYCFLRAGTRLSLAQKYALLGTLRQYNRVSWPVGVTLAVAFALPLILAWRRRYREGLPEKPEELARWRRRIVRLPWWLAGVNSLTWFPSLWVFTVAADKLTGSFSAAGFAHFATAVVVSWLIATTYATLYVAFYSARVLYPAFLSGKVAGESGRELASLRRLARALPIFAGLIPLVAALLLLSMGPGELSPGRYRSFQLLLIALIGGGGAGMVLTIRVVERLQRILRVLGGDVNREMRKL